MAQGRKGYHTKEDRESYCQTMWQSIENCNHEWAWGKTVHNPWCNACIGSISYDIIYMFIKFSAKIENSGSSHFATYQSRQWMDLPFAQQLCKKGVQ